MKALTEPLFAPGDPVWYLHAQRGGYCLVTHVPAEFVRATKTRAIIRAYLKSGATTLVTVHPKHLRPRDPAAVWR